MGYVFIFGTGTQDQAGPWAQAQAGSGARALFTARAVCSQFFDDHIWAHGPMGPGPGAAARTLPILILANPR